MHTYNATPSIAYRINDWISVGAGVQIQYAKEASDTGPRGQRRALQAVVKGNGWGYGFTAGATLTPTPTTTIGTWLSLIVRSKNRLHAEYHSVPPLTTIGSINTTVKAARHRFAWHSPAA